MSGFDLPPLDLTMRLPQPMLGGTPRRGNAIGSEVAPGGDLPAGLQPSGGQFGNLLTNALDRVQSLQNDVRDKTRDIAMGEPVQLHDLLSAMGKSEAAFNLMLEVRNKLVDAWEKVSRSVV
ncbi:MAG: flagellar hook-basal body complex protein FliE [Planctomycetes bacterium]|nr:flagellar hook-basal body complex protein FliE [Planctomycetota bacterium]